MYAILSRSLLKPASVLSRLGAGCDGWISSVGLARLVPAVPFGRVEAGRDDGISSSESERFFCGDLITGCDTVNAFAGRGKAQALKILKKNTRIREALTELGKEWDLPPKFTEKLEELTCLLYSSNAVTTNVNELWYLLFCSRRGEIESHQLPPCRDCLVKHAKRANYLVAIWKRCLEQDTHVPTPIGRGWKIEDEDGVAKLVVDWMDVKAAPEATLELLACNCTKTWVAPKCVCVTNGLRCTDMCRRAECENQGSVQEIESADDDDGADSDKEY